MRGSHRVDLEQRLSSSEQRLSSSGKSLTAEVLEG